MFRFDVGGLENGIVNLINHFPESSYRHAIVALDEVTDFRLRIRHQDVSFHALHKGPGHGIKLFPQLYRLFKELRPAIVHTRNLAALEAAVPAWAAGVKVRLHGEHGWDVGDPNGNSRKYQWVRRLYSPFVSHYIALSRDLERYLTERVGIAAGRVSQIYNGVDTERFHPAPAGRELLEACPFTDPSLWVVGTVGRMAVIKDQVNLARAFVRALMMKPRSREKLRLVMVGEGPQKAEVERVLSEAGVRELAWLPGKRDDVAHLLRGMDGFVLPSLGEGISNTILEAMASGLPVIATDVGGNGELVVSDETGERVPAANPDAMAAAILRQYLNPVLSVAMGRAGRSRVERLFSMDSMVRNYLKVYDEALCLPGSRRMTPV
jgi:sugar transferase (PEP-CTERM/EpsH1 system associated)